MNRIDLCLDKIIFVCLLLLFSIGIASAVCTDSDNGLNYYLKGSTNISRNMNSYCLFNDRCYNNYILKEYYCYNGNIRYIYFNCGTAGCSNGACAGSAQNICTPGALQEGTCNVCNSAGTAYLNKCTANQICSSGNCITPQVCTPGTTQSGTVCNVCNAAGSSYNADSTKCLTAQTCNAGQCVSTQFCTPNSVQSGTTCNVCNAAGTAYVPTVSKCSSRQTCNSAGACVSSSVCTAPSCNGAQYCSNGQWANCASGQICSAGACVSNQVQACTPGVLKSGTTCFVCNSAGTAYVSDATKCSTSQCGLSGACLSAPSTTSPPSNKSMWVIAYYPNWWWGTLDPQNLDWTGMTHMVLFTGSGISTSSPYFSSTGLSGTALTNTISTAHSHGVKILLSLASVYPGSNWNAIASDNSKIDSLVSSAVAFAKANNFDGIELDIEWPSAMAPHDYLMDKLRAALDAWPTRGILVSAIDMAPFHSAYDPVVMNRDLDMMFAMTYTSWVNCGGPVAGFGTPVYKSTQFPNLQGCTLNDNAIDFITQGYDPSKMAISVTFEAIRMGGSAQKPGDAFSKSNWSFTQARNDMRSSNTAVINYDDSAKAAWSYWNGDYYDLQTPQSISEVVAWTKQHNFGGMMAYDTPAGWLPSKTGTAANPLWEALVSAVNNPSTPSGTASYCTPNAVQTTTQCNVCNSAGTAYAPSTAACSGQACTSGMCTVAATSPYCTPNAVQSGTTCNVCNSAGTAYIPTVSKCSSGQTCNSAGACVSSSVCTAPSCNGVQYCLNGQWASCASGQTCNAGACVSSVICTFGTTKTGTTCLSCNAAGTSYVVDSTKCASGQTCNSVGACITSGTGTWNGGVPVGSTIPVAGGNYFLLGTNYPWKSFDGDFGSGSIKVGSSYETDMTKLQGYGVHVVRWWLFPHGGKDYGFITYSGGAPTGLTSKFYTDMDGAIAIAKKDNLYLVPVFLSFDTANSNANLFDNGPNTQAFIDNVVVPIMQHYPNEPRILAWEIMNEPEGAISDGPLGGGAWTSTKISGASFYNIASKICAAVHQYTTSYCTTGSNGVDFLQYYMDSYTSTHNLPQLHFDFYEAHYYGYGSNVYSTAVSSIKGGIDHPVVIGEIDGTTVSTSNFDKLLANGYAGVWPWAYAPDTKAIPWNTFTAWANAHTAAINIPAAN